MKIHKIKHDSASSTQLDLNQFSRELRALSDRHGVKLVSIGAMHDQTAIYQREANFLSQSGWWYVRLLLQV
jgi:hypothetical protein